MEGARNKYGGIAHCRVLCPEAVPLAGLDGGGPDFVVA